MYRTRETFQFLWKLDPGWPHGPFWSLTFKSPFFKGPKNLRVPLRLFLENQILLTCWPNGTKFFFQMGLCKVNDKLLARFPWAIRIPGDEFHVKCKYDGKITPHFLICMNCKFDEKIENLPKIDDSGKWRPPPPRSHWYLVPTLGIFLRSLFLVTLITQKKWSPWSRVLFTIGSRWISVDWKRATAVNIHSESLDWLPWLKVPHTCVPRFLLVQCSIFHEDSHF